MRGRGRLLQKGINMNYSLVAEKYESYIISVRRRLHEQPELSWQERGTTAFIASELERMGYKVKRFPDATGLIAEIKGGKAAEGCATVCLRADIDALPVDERTGLPFASKNAGKMHACGHDCHIAMLLGAAAMIAETSEQIAGSVRLLFQAAEETCEGAPFFIKNGALDGVAAIFGMHIWGTLNAPYINIEPGPRMAACDNFDIHIKGRSAHGTEPHHGTDAVVAAAAVIMALQTVVSRDIDPMTPAVVTMGEMSGGRRFNIIAADAVLHGTARSFDEATRGRIEQSVRRIAEKTAAAYGATAEVEYNRLPPPLVNDEAVAAAAREAAVKLYGEQGLRPMQAVMGSEDFAYYTQLIPGCYAFIGARNTEKGMTATNHNDCFAPDEASLKRGSALYAQFAADFIENSIK